MQSFTKVEGPAAPLPGANTNTDVIMPKQYLKGIDRSGLDKGCLRPLRFTPDGKLQPDFVLNQKEWADTCFLVVGPNFGCGSSREHAVWGLMQIGIHAIIGTSFAGIFNDNAANNGLLLIEMDEKTIGKLNDLASDPKRNHLAIDLPTQTITTSAGEAIHFDIKDGVKHRLVHGIDPITDTMQHEEDIRSFEKQHFKEFPWLLQTENRQLGV